MQSPLGDIGRQRLLRLFFCCRKQMYVKLTKGAMQGPLGDIGRYGDYLGDTGSHRD